VRQRPSSEALVILTREGGAIPTLMLHSASRRERLATGLGDLHDAPVHVTLTGRGSGYGIIDSSVGALDVFPCQRPVLPALDLVVRVKPGRCGVSHNSTSTILAHSLANSSHARHEKVR